MNLLLYRCPEDLTVDGVKYPINSDHRTSILFELAVQDAGLSEADLVGFMLDMYFVGEYPSRLDKAIEEVLKFYTLSSIRKNRRALEGSGSPGKHKQLYSFEYDQEFILSSFMEAYNIDLTSETLHWWKFRVLFDNLPESTSIKEIVNIRGTKISSDMSKEERKRINKLKRIHELPVNRMTKEERDLDFNDGMSGMF